MSNFKSLISSPLMNLDHIYRYSGVKQAELESLSTHIVEVQVLGYLIIDHLNSTYGELLDSGLFLEKAFHHDMEECITGDVSRPLKYHDEEILQNMRNVATSVATTLYKNSFGANTYHHSLSNWQCAKDGREGFILKIVDTLTVVNKTLKEVELLGNMYFLKVAFEVSHYLNELHDSIMSINTEEEFCKESIGYLAGLIGEATMIIGRLMLDHKDVMDLYDLTSLSMIGGKNE